MIEFKFDGDRHLESLDAMVRIMAARLKLPASTDCVNVNAGSAADLAAHLRSSAGNLRHLADLMTHASIRIEANALDQPRANLVS